MPDEPESPSRRARLLAASAVVAFGLGGVVGLLDGAGPPPTTPRFAEGAVICDEDGWRYSFHLATGAEGLFDLRDDPRQLHDVLPAHEDVARRLRLRVETSLHVPSVEALRARRADAVQRLRSLGYL